MVHTLEGETRENEWVTRGLTGMVFVLVVMGAVAWAAWSNALLWALVAALMVRVVQGT